jgi:hypothetical protein
MQPSLRNLLIIVGAVLALWVIVQSSASQGQAPPTPARWEYNVAITNFQAFQLNQQGREGWELVTITENQPNTGYVAVFKRPAR